ncbi:mitochondrial 2-oxoglutarate/malate carrier protein-like [Telopea speciosissima]|uniref:mitochondrial 2-oxoglutarate/malate carrier protein-like n=1 Tax=Telopea speciosissima TaxID=54955 RepID=UPI001CC6E081|nr:mitochondrial 2-oxoglutarate/malate carrier protein-like [Telopea speciosissima]
MALLSVTRCLEGVDYHDTYALVVKLVLVRVLLAITTAQGRPLHQMGINNAFLYGDLNEEAYMMLPPGCRQKGSSMDSGYTGVRLATTPMEQNLKLTNDLGDPLSDPSFYRRLVGRLIYLSVTHPDIVQDHHSLTVNRAMIVTTSQLVTDDQVKEMIPGNGVMKDGLGTHVTASFAAGFVAAVASNPVDVIKTRVLNMKVEAVVEPPYSRAMDCALKTVRTEGPMALYKGFIPTISRQGPFTMVLFVTLEQVRKLLKDFSLR